MLRPEHYRKVNVQCYHALSGLCSALILVLDLAVLQAELVNAGYGEKDLARIPAAAGRGDCWRGLGCVSKGEILASGADGAARLSHGLAGSLDGCAGARLVRPQTRDLDRASIAGGDSVHPLSLDGPLFRYMQVLMHPFALSGLEVYIADKLFL